MPRRTRLPGPRARTFRSSPQKDFFASSCAPLLGKMMIDAIDEDLTVAQSARDRLMASVTTRPDFAMTLVRSFPEEVHRGFEDIYHAARKVLGL